MIFIYIIQIFFFMFSYRFNYIFITNTPLEQFDQVSWVSNHVIETLEPYIFFISERDFSAIQRYTNTYNITSNNFELLPIASNQILIIIIISVLIINQTSVLQFIFEITNKFSIFFLIGFRHLFTGTFITFWFSDFFFIIEEIDTTTSTILSNKFSFAPQIDLSYGIDEILITLIIAFFLIGSGETEDEEDFLIYDEADLDIVEEMVAPLFVANLTKDIPENGALYLKVCSIFSFVLISNLRGRIPYGDTATSSLVLTFWVALSVFGSLITLRIRKHGIHYLFSLFRPSGCPFPLLFLLMPIEFLSYSFRVVSLSVRLFANRRAGHTLRKVLIGFSYIRFTLGDGYAIAAFLPAFIVFVLIFLERAVAGIQAYIFTILTCIYLKDLYVAH